MDSTIIYRSATREDIPSVLRLIHALAEYEHEPQAVSATPEKLEHWLFERSAAEVVVACTADAQVIGMALFFQNFSTWTASGGLYLEDLFVEKDYRSQGVGTALMAHLAALAVERGYDRFQWACLDWNEPSLKFYEHLGAQRTEEWVPLRLEGKALLNLAAQAQEQQL